MNNSDEKQFGEFIRQHIEAAGEPEPPRDLWPQMLRRLETSNVRVTWLDWVLAALAFTLCLIAPEALPGLLYHL